MKLNEDSNLKLIGKKEEDLKVISAYLQDSVVTIKDIAYLKKSRTFIMIVNRFMWEDAEKGVFRKNKRTRCALKFEEVVSVRSKNVNQKNKKKPLECLAIKCDFTSDKIYKLKIFFAGDAIITLTTEVIEVMLHDFGESWNVKHVPIHKI